MQRGLLICENGEGDAAPMYIGGETPINSICLAAMINTLLAFAVFPLLDDLLELFFAFLVF
jgi:hypothetical protein